MALEDLTGAKYVSALVRTNPELADDIAQGDDHLRGLKNVLLNTFPNLTAAVTLTAAQINALPGDLAAVLAAVPVASNAIAPMNDQAAGSIGGQTDQYALEDHRHPASGLGYGGQSWKTVVRDANTQYNNMTGRPILVRIHGQPSVSYAYIRISTGGVAILGAAQASSAYGMCEAIIPPGAGWAWDMNAGGLANVTAYELS